MVVTSSTIEERLFSVCLVRKLLSVEVNPPIQAVIDSGCVPTLVTIMKMYQEQELIYEAAWALTNIASGNTEHTNAIVDTGVISTFIDILAQPVSICGLQIKEQVIWVFIFFIFFHFILFLFSLTQKHFFFFFFQRHSETLLEIQFGTEIDALRQALLKKLQAVCSFLEFLSRLLATAPGLCRTFAEASHSPSPKSVPIFSRSLPNLLPNLATRTLSPIRCGVFPTFPTPRTIV